MKNENPPVMPRLLATQGESRSRAGDFTPKLLTPEDKHFLLLRLIAYNPKNHMQQLKPYGSTATDGKTSHAVNDVTIRTENRVPTIVM